MCLYIYTYIYLHIYVCLYVCVYVCVCLYVCRYVCAYIYVYVYMYVCIMNACIYVCIYVYTMYMYVCMYVCIFVCVYYVLTYVCMHVSIYVCSIKITQQLNSSIISLTVQQSYYNLFVCCFNLLLLSVANYLTMYTILSQISVIFGPVAALRILFSLEEKLINVSMKPFTVLTHVFYVIPTSPRPSPSNRPLRAISCFL